MNDLNLIANWIRDPKRKFAEGLLLYNKYKSSNKFDDFFQKNLKKPDQAATSVLFQALSKVNRILNTNPSLAEKKSADIAIQNKENSKPPVIASSKKKSQGVTARDIHDIPLHLHDEFRQIQAIVPKLGGLHAKLKASKSKKTAAKLSKEIAELDQLKRDLWSKLDEATEKKKP